MSITWQNQCLSGIPPSGIRKFFDVVSDMKGAVSLGVGEPDFDTPCIISQAGVQAIERGLTHYSSNWGTPELRQAIADYQHARYNLQYDPTSQVLVTVGASEGIDIALRCLLEPGDHVLVPEPSYVSYQPCVTMAGGIPIPMPLQAEDQFRLTPQILRAAITPRTRALILPFPNNPTGAVMERTHLQALAEVLRERDIAILSDEIYSELTYTDKRHASIAELPGMYEKTIVLNGFSKSFAMTGWRLGYACGPKEAIAGMCKIHQYTMLCAPIMAQHAALAGLRAGLESDFDFLQSMKSQYNTRRRYLIDAFNAMGLDTFEAQGAFYLFPSVQRTGMTSEAFCETLLCEEKVAVVPGTAFGASGEGFIRVSYAYSMANLQEAVARMGRFMQRHRQ